MEERGGSVRQKVEYRDGGVRERGEDGRETEEGEGEQRGREKTNGSTALICFSVRGMQREGRGVTFILFSLPVAIRRIDN